MAMVDFKSLSTVYLRMAACIRLEEGDIPRLDPVTLIPRVLPCLNLNGETKREVETLAVRLVEYLERMGFGSGKKPQIMAGTAVLIAHVACKATKPSNPTCQLIASSSFFAVNTLKKRFFEWTDHLIQRAHMFPWLMDVHRKNLHKHLYQVLQTLELPTPGSEKPIIIPDTSSSETSEDMIKEVDQLMEELLS
jgi:hypothetical protein